MVKARIRDGLVDAFCAMTNTQLRNLRHHMRNGNKVYCGEGSRGSYISDNGHG